GRRVGAGRRPDARRPRQGRYAEPAAPPRAPVITPRRTRLIRVPDLHAFRHAIVGLSLSGDLQRLLSRVVLVPTDGAARQLKRTLRSEQAPALATRAEFYDDLYARLDDPPHRLTAYDRDVIVQSAAREASSTLGLGR